MSFAIDGQSDPRPAPLASVIICVYNGIAFLRETLDSVCRQTFRDLEIVAVDDGSTDGSLELLSSYGDPRLRVLQQQHRGAVATLNAGLEAAHGRYVGILDQDDLWRPNKLEVHCEVLDAEADVDVTFSRYGIIDERSREIGLRSPRSEGRYSFASLLADYRIGPNSTVIVRREALNRAGRADPALPRLYDFELLLRTAMVRPRNVAAVPAELTLYRRHSDQISSDWQEMYREWEKVMEKLGRLEPEAVATVAARAEANMNRYFAMVAYEGGDYRNAAGRLWSTLRRFPIAFASDPRTWRASAAIGAGLLLPRSLHRKLESLVGLRRGAAT
jgi:glycosyltransferase involved in cell wall biosynthesis